jgi:hypothetical protein
MDKWIRGITVRRTPDSVWAEAEVSLGKTVQIVTSSGGRQPDADTSSEEAQLSELRRRLYAVGFSKRAIATAVKSVVRVESHGN